MSPTIPSVFLEQMKERLQDEYDSFLATYEQAPERSFRVNRLRTTPGELVEELPFTTLENVPWCPEAYYYQHEVDRPGKHPFHAAGVYYIQDASAMSPAEALEAKPGETILDLCAAPGGKTTQIASHMQGEGILVANEIDGKRIKILVENLERCGVPNAVVLNEDPNHLTDRFPQFFDRILIDAPCSGEGMFRKDDESGERWSPRLVEKCAELQMEILRATAPMLKDGGRLVYSTCTFNPLENEEVVASFLAEFSEFELIPVPQASHYQPGRLDWMENPDPRLALAGRLWPHHLRGEGHFVAVLQKGDSETSRKTKIGKTASIPKDRKKLYDTFVQDHLLDSSWIEGEFTLYGEHLYRTPSGFPSLKGLKVERPGMHLGQIKKSHFQPSHAFALALQSDKVKRVRNLSWNGNDLLLYLQGETLPDQQSGWTLVTVDNYPLGWGKASGGLLKNHYPKWLRWEKYRTI
ncbi:RsmB/NOP family class I SAM-dependent RNA methyltransferase [Baia soyae]|uniref:16S rRNA (Cytosine(967)-C(5))-methyltransferase n=1 Tax=Baia soyae TaxID=1544746 RepID=A0A4R2RUV1_9BACL|nr:RsmB/NOP family class I SAM-dependent RNA methyltransferase [Baia soyae]TCP66457.1 16S rRNA (cytosine(967)-C(5))-methyltransferase [Baia soyae]